MDYRNSTQSGIPRGIRNNNPGNFRKDSPRYQGVTGDDGAFYIFDDMTWGIRAIGVDLSTKINKDGLNTIRLIITRYAPPSENDTESYISDVSDYSGYGPDDPLQADSSTLTLLSRGIINHENGEVFSAQYISDQDLAQGIAMMNPSVSQVLQAGVIAAGANPGLTLGIIAAGIGLLYLISDGIKKETH